MTRLLLRIASCQFVVLAAIAPGFAKDSKFREKGVLAEMQSVSCGFAQKSGHTVAGVLITGAEHTKSRELLCQEYTLKADRVTYRIRPKDEKHPALLPVGEQAEFRLKKDEMLLRIPEVDNKEREYIVVSMTPTNELASEIDSTRRPPKPHASSAMDMTGTPAASAPVPSPPVPAMPTTTTPASPAPVVQSPSGASAVAETTGSVLVKSFPSGAEIFLDSVRVGQTPGQVKLNPGVHSIQVVLPGYQDWVTKINVSAGSQQQVTANLTR